MDVISAIYSTVISNCINADKESLDLIISDSIKSTRNWLEGNISGVHLVYIKGENIVGTILIKEYWNMSALYVLPDYHKMGIGTMLVDYAIEACKANSEVDEIRLNSSTFASAFYQKYGFVKNGQERDLPGGCIPYVYNS